jgi:hypothetical protein
VQLRAIQLVIEIPKSASKDETIEPEAQTNHREINTKLRLVDIAGQFPNFSLRRNSLSQLCN